MYKSFREACRSALKFIGFKRQTVQPSATVSEGETKTEQPRPMDLSEVLSLIRMIPEFLQDAALEKNIGLAASVVSPALAGLEKLPDNRDQIVEASVQGVLPELPMLAQKHNGVAHIASVFLSHVLKIDNDKLFDGVCGSSHGWNETTLNALILSIPEHKFFAVALRQTSTTDKPNRLIISSPLSIDGSDKFLDVVKEKYPDILGRAQTFVDEAEKLLTAQRLPQTLAWAADVRLTNLRAMSIRPDAVTQTQAPTTPREP